MGSLLPSEYHQISSSIWEMSHAGNASASTLLYPTGHATHQAQNMTVNKKQCAACATWRLQFNQQGQLRNCMCMPRLVNEVASP